MRPLFRVPVTGPRPPRFARHRWLGDKVDMVVHDLDATVGSCRIDAVAASGRAATFGPDLLAEARNRGYRPCPRCVKRAP